LRFLEGKAVAAAAITLGVSTHKMQAAAWAELAGITRLHAIFMLAMLELLA